MHCDFLLLQKRQANHYSSFHSAQATVTLNSRQLIHGKEQWMDNYPIGRLNMHLSFLDEWQPYPIRPLNRTITSFQGLLFTAFKAFSLMYIQSNQCTSASELPIGAPLTDWLQGQGQQSSLLVIVRSAQYSQLQCKHWSIMPVGAPLLLLDRSRGVTLAMFTFLDSSLLWLRFSFSPPSPRRGIWSPSAACCPTSTPAQQYSH